jgi:hypothetical protein
MPDAQRVVVLGGFETLSSFAPSSGLDIFDEVALTVTTLDVGGAPRVLREGRGGLAATAIGDGTVLISGGDGEIAGIRGPLTSGEIFTDPDAPTGVE